MRSVLKKVSLAKWEPFSFALQFSQVSSHVNLHSEYKYIHVVLLRI